MRTLTLLIIALTMAPLLAVPVAGAAWHGSYDDSGQYFCQSSNESDETQQVPEEEEEEPDCD